jgi:putative FmdB family regulatory protein
MPLYDFKCRICGVTFEQIVPCEISLVPCRECAAAPADRTTLGQGLADRQLSAPGGIRANGANGGMVLSEAQMKKIKEPVWQDEKTGAVTSAH